jgi:fibrillarin-like rRNA methylase
MVWGKKKIKKKEKKKKNRNFLTRNFRCFRKVQGEQEVQVRAKDVSTCPECEEVIEEGQERTIVSGVEWHKW